jgi:DNA-binding CsgD family transcriptional regulator
MGSPVDYVHKKYAPLLDKTLKNAVAHCIGKEFPRIGGPRMRDLCAALVLEVVAAHLRPREHVTHGQMLWMAVSVNDPPRRGRRIAETDLVPVVLDVSTDQDVHDRLERLAPSQRQLNKALRLCRQAYEQGGLLSNCDLAELLGVGDSRISHLLAAHERETDQLVPRRATVHDVGTGLTHKRIICHKHYAEGKPPDQVARETYHSLEAVDRYLGQYDRVRHCRREGLSAEETAQMLNCGVSLVREYLRIDRELEGQDA